MRVVDSSAWVEWLSDSPTASLLENEMPDRETTVVPTIVQLELAKWLVREVSEEAADDFAALSRISLVIPLDTSIAIRAAELSRQHKLSTADAIIYATALHVDADLLTCDAHFEGLARVLYIPKAEV